MLLHGVLKCYVLYVLFVLCATVNHQRVSKIDKRVRNLRRSLEGLDNHIKKSDNNIESEQPDEEADSLNNENDENGENEEQQSGLEADDVTKRKKIKEWSKTKEIDPTTAPTEDVKPSLDVLDSSVDKILEMSKLSAMNGFDYSPSEVEKFKIWPQGIIPFYIDEFSYDKILRDKIREYLDEANGMTGLRFLELPRPPTDDSTRWVFIINRRGQLECADNTYKSFTNTGVQKLVIGYDCLGGPQHIASVVLALAGVPPQHNSPDRDKYIEVSTKSIQPDKIELFTAVKPEDWLFHDIKYDFLSASHYPCHKYTIDGSATIVPKSKISTFIGEGDRLSYSDVLKIRVLYNFIVEKDDKNAKLPDCKALYRPGPKFKMGDTQDQPTLPARKKPKEYIDAARKAGLDIVEGSESTPSAPENENTVQENGNDTEDKLNKSDDESNDEGNDNKDEKNDEPNNNDSEIPNENNVKIKKNLKDINSSNGIYYDENGESSGKLETTATQEESEELLKDYVTITTTGNPMNINDSVTSSE